MKPNAALCTATLLILAGMACGKPKTVQAAQSLQTAQATPKANNLPSWVLKPQSYPGLPATTLAEVGSERANAAGDIMLQRRLAMLHARYQIGARLGVGVQGFLKTAHLADAGDSAASDRNIHDQTVATASQGIVTELVDTSLSGVTPQEFWIDPATGRLYVLATLDREAVAGSLQATLSSRNQDAAALIAGNQQILDDILAKAAAGQPK